MQFRRVHDPPAQLRKRWFDLLINLIDDPKPLKNYADVIQQLPPPMN